MLKQDGHGVILNNYNQQGIHEIGLNDWKQKLDLFKIYKNQRNSFMNIVKRVFRIIKKSIKKECLLQ